MLRLEKISKSFEQRGTVLDKLNAQADSSQLEELKGHLGRPSQVKY